MVALQSARNLVQVVVPARACSALRRIARQRSHRAEPVQVVPIDDIVPEDRPVSIIQLDVEVYEQWALRTIRRCRPVMETLPNDGRLAEYPAPLGYRPGGRIAENVVLACI
jgi:hypothetical protein